MVFKPREVFSQNFVLILNLKFKIEIFWSWLLTCSNNIYRFERNGQGKWNGQLVIPGLPDKWTSKRPVCMCE